MAAVMIHRDTSYG